MCDMIVERSHKKTREPVVGRDIVRRTQLVFQPRGRQFSLVIYNRKFAVRHGVGGYQDN